MSDDDELGTFSGLYTVDVTGPMSNGVLGSPATPHATLVAYRHAWIVTAAISLVGALVAWALLKRRPARVELLDATHSATVRT